MIGIAYLKTRISQYAALWLGGFLASGALLLLAQLFIDFMEAADLVLPFMLAGMTLLLGVGVIITLLSRQTVATKLIVGVFAVVMLLPLLWAPVSAAVLAAFLMDRSIEYSVAYASFQIGVAQVLYPLSEWFLGGAMFGAVWQGFQMFASAVGFVAALVRAWPVLKRILGPEPATSTLRQ